MLVVEFVVEIRHIVGKRLCVMLVGCVEHEPLPELKHSCKHVHVLVEG